MRAFGWICGLIMLAAAGPGVAAPCPDGDHEQRVTGVTECLLMRSFRTPVPDRPRALLVLLHGDVSDGGPASYHFALAERAAASWDIGPAIVVALVRPGYPDGSGAASGGEDYGRRDHYTRDNVDEVAGAVRRLKARHGTERVVLLGHSGGAATSAVILGRHPGLATAAVLVSCPCDLEAWRDWRNSRPWSRSEDPRQWIGKIPPATAIALVTARGDTNTPPFLAERYVERVRQRGIAASLQIVADGTHNSAFRSAAVRDAVVGYLKAGGDAVPR